MSSSGHLEKQETWDSQAVQDSPRLWTSPSRSLACDPPLWEATSDPGWQQPWLMGGGKRGVDKGVHSAPQRAPPN